MQIYRRIRLPTPEPLFIVLVPVVVLCDKEEEPVVAIPMLLQWI